MGRIDELVSAEFAKWEQRGRGWKVWPEPVRPEPPFEEFTGYRIVDAPLEVDDSRRPGFLASLFDSLEKKLKPPPPVEVMEESEEPEPAVSDEPLSAEFIASLPASLDVSEETLQALLDSLNACAEPTCFELLANHERITLQLASSAQDAPALQRQLNAFLPKLSFTPTEGNLAETWHEDDGIGFIVDFGLAHEFMLPLQTGHAVDPFVGLISVLNELQSGEVAVFQVLFQPVQHRWPSSVWRSVTGENGKALFLNRPHLIPGTKQKLESPLFGVVVRAAARAETFDRAADLIQQMAFALRAFTRDDGNRLIPLHNEEYDYDSHEENLLQRQSRRSGMLLNREELLGFVHLPANEISASRLKRQRTHTKAAPSIALSPSGILLGLNEHAGRVTPVHLSADQRVNHVHVIGASGTGKSTLLFNLIRQDIENGQGVAVLDPHGDLVERILTVIPAHRMEDVIFVDPTDEEFSIGFNILSAHSDFEKNLIASDLVSVFRRLSSSWGDQLNSVLNNAILAFLESSRGGTLGDLRRFLLDAEFRNDFLETVRDPDVVYYWRKAFPQLGGNKSIGPVLTRLDTFLSPKPIRYMVSQPVNRLDFAHIIDGGKILLAKLSQGLVGKENAFLLGSLLLSKFQQLAMSRQRLNVEQRRDFWIYMDEFQNFITPSMAEILSGTRKYRIGLVMAHHDLHQLQRDADVASAVLTNPYTRIVFRVGDADAVALAKGFASFDAKDFQNLGTGEAVCRMERSDGDFNVRILPPELPDPHAAAATRQQAVTSSRIKYATARADIEAAILRAMPADKPEPPKKRAAKKESSVPVEPASQDSGPSPVPNVSEPPSEPKPAEVRNEPVSIIQEPEIAPISPIVVKAAPSEPVPAAPQIEAVQNEAVPETKAPEIAPVIQTVSEAPLPEPVVVREPAPPRKLGRGGQEHKDLQEWIQKEAHSLGFFAAVESQLAKQSNQAADLVLKRDAISIAVEIPNTNSTRKEFGNVKKCLAAGFTRVAVVSLKPEKLRAIEQAVQTGCGSEPAKQVGFYSPDELIAELRRLVAEQGPSAVEANPSDPKTRITRGFVVRRHAPKLSAAERKEKESLAMKLTAQVMKPKPKI